MFLFAKMVGFFYNGGIRSGRWPWELFLSRRLFGFHCLACFLLLMFGVACHAEEKPAVDASKKSQQAVRSDGKEKMKMEITSSAFTEGRPIPKKYTGEGKDVSPPLAWSGIPENAKELVLICDDPDAPGREPWVHWVIYKISPKVKELQEGIPREPRLKTPPGSLQGKNSWPEAEAMGYRGPMPPRGHGVHHYYFKLYALDAEIQGEPGLTKKAVLEKIHGHILAEGCLMGTYER